MRGIATEPLELSVEKKEDGKEILILDNLELHHVEKYKITKSSDMKGMTELEVKLLVKFP